MCYRLLPPLTMAASWSGVESMISRALSAGHSKEGASVQLSRARLSLARNCARGMVCAPISSLYAISIPRSQ